MSERYILKLFVNGNHTDTKAIIEKVEQMCKSSLKENYNLKIIDIDIDVDAALEYNVLLVPMLLLESPKPKVTIIGSMADKDKILTALRL